MINYKSSINEMTFVEIFNAFKSIQMCVCNIKNKQQQLCRIIEDFFWIKTKNENRQNKYFIDY